MTPDPSPQASVKMFSSQVVQRPAWKTGKMKRSSPVSQEKDPSETPLTGVHWSRRTAEHSGLGSFCWPTHQYEDESESRDSSRDSSVCRKDSRGERSSESTDMLQRRHWTQLGLCLNYCCLQLTRMSTDLQQH